jgi:hypothetical protein
MKIGAFLGRFEQCPAEMSAWAEQCPVRSFCEVYLNFGVARVGPDNVRLGQTMSGWRFLFEDDLERTWSCSSRLFSLHPSYPS